jgi:hypothetical protein
MNAPRFEIENVVFLDRRNRAFVERTSLRTAGEQKARWMAWTIGFASLLFCVPLVLFAVNTFVRGDRLARTGQRTTGVIVNKRESNDPESGILCHVTYRFSVARSSYEREIEVSNRVCPALTIGQDVEVLYNPRDPSVSNLKVSIDTPRYPVWLAVVCCLFALAAVRSKISTLAREHRFSTQGVIVYGFVIGKEYTENDAGRDVIIRYSFRAPSGSTIESIARGPRWQSTLAESPHSSDSKHDSVAVLFLSDAEFALL